MGVVGGVCSGYDGCSITGVQCTIRRVVCAVYGVCSVWCVQCMVCAEYMGYTVYGGAVAVHHHVSTVSCVWRVVCAVYDVCGV